jgi:tetratricopeptide (TPR) repeat protein
LLFTRARRYEAAGLLADAGRCCREALAFLEKATAAEPNELRNIYALATCRYNLAMYLGACGKHEESAEVWEKSLQDWRALTLIDPNSSEYQGRVGATLSNLAALASYRKDFQRCRELAEEALSIQKRALKLEPVYEHAKDFLGTHYKILSRALTGLEDHAALAAIAEERVQVLSEVPSDLCAAALSLADCLRLLNKDDRLAPQQKDELASHYAQRAVTLLKEAAERFRGWDKAAFTVAYTGIQVGDRLAAVDHFSAAQQSWQNARGLLTSLRGKAPPEAQRELEKVYINPLDKRLARQLLAKPSIEEGGLTAEALAHAPALRHFLEQPKRGGE